MAYHRGMRVTYSPDADAAYLYLVEIGPGQVTRTQSCDVAKGTINLDCDASGQLLGIEILDARELLPLNVIERAEIL